MRNLCWGILVLGCMGCASGKAYYHETYNDAGELISIEAGVIEYQRLWGSKSDIRNIDVDTKSKDSWTLKAGQDVTSDQGEASEIIGGMLAAFKLGLTVGAGVPIAP